MSIFLEMAPVFVGGGKLVKSKSNLPERFQLLNTICVQSVLQTQIVVVDQQQSILEHNVRLSMFEELLMEVRRMNKREERLSWILLIVHKRVY